MSLLRVKSVLKKDIVHHIFSVSMGRILTSGLYFLFILILMKFLSVEEYGKYTYYYSILAIIPFFLDLGTNNAFVALGSKKLSISLKEYFLYKNNYLFIKYIILFIVIAMLYIFYYTNVINTILLYIIIFGILFSMQEIFSAILASQRKFKILSFLMPTRNIIALLLLIICLFIFNKDIKDFDAIKIIGLSALITLIIYMCIVKNYKINFKKVSLQICKKILTYSSWLIVYSFTITIMMRLEIFILEYYSNRNIISPKELGYFSAAFSLTFILPMIATSVTKVMLPNMAKIVYIDEAKKYIKNLKKIFLPLLIVVSIIMTIVTVYIYLFSYNKYGHSIIPFIIITYATVIGFFLNLLITLFYASNSTKLIALVGIQQLIIGFIVGTILIYNLGAIGAAMSVFFIRIVGLFIAMRYLSNLDILFIRREV